MPVPVLSHSFCKNFSFIFSQKSPSCNLWPLPLPPFAVHLSSVIAVSHDTSYNANENIYNFRLERANLHIWKRNWYLQTSLISACTTCVFSKHSQAFAFKHAIVNFDKYGCLIQYLSNTEKKSIHVKAWEWAYKSQSRHTFWSVWSIF